MAAAATERPARRARPVPRAGAAAFLTAVAVLPPATVSVLASEPAPAPFPELAATLDAGRVLFERSWSFADGAGHRDLHGRLTLEKAERMGGDAVEFTLLATPAATACSACHDSPFGVSGGSGRMIANVVVAGAAGVGSGDGVVLVNASAPPGMYGAGYVELLAAEMSRELRRRRDALAPGGSVALIAKGVSFGRLARAADGAWDTSGVRGLSELSLHTAGARFPPSLRVRPFHPAGAAATLREFSLNAFDFHLGLQGVERFGDGVDPDRDGITDELSREQVRTITLYQATLPVPGRVVPAQAAGARRVWRGERLFAATGCADCHVPALALESDLYRDPAVDDEEPHRGGMQPRAVRLSDRRLPPPRLEQCDGRVAVPLYSDLRLHDLGGANHDPLFLHAATGSERFFAGTRRFVTARLWGAANQPPYFHDGRYTTLPQAIAAHGGEARRARTAYENLSATDREAVLAFLRSLQVLPPGTASRVVDSTGAARAWPPADAGTDCHGPPARPLRLSELGHVDSGGAP